MLAMLTGAVPGVFAPIPPIGPVIEFEAVIRIETMIPVEAVVAAEPSIVVGAMIGIAPMRPVKPMFSIGPIEPVEAIVIKPMIPVETMVRIAPIMPVGAIIGVEPISLVGPMTGIEPKSVIVIMIVVVIMAPVRKVPAHVDREFGAGRSAFGVFRRHGQDDVFVGVTGMQGQTCKLRLRERDAAVHDLQMIAMAVGQSHIRRQA